MVDIAFVGRFPRPVTLAALREDAALEGLALTRRGSRLSVLPVTEAHFRHICRLGR